MLHIQNKMSLLTCITCQVAFTSPELQRSHYKSDWHRYNLKRKVAELPPITNELFLVKVSLMNQTTVEVNEESYCEVCRKYFSSKNAYENHVNSKKHRQNISKEKDSQGKSSSEKSGHDIPSMKLNETHQVQSSHNIAYEDDVADSADDDSDWESCDEDFEVNSCIFCAHESDDLQSNMQHMTGFHSFFIPDVEYVIDLPGLIAYLYEKVTVGCVCTWCGKEFNSAKSTQQHMMDIGHCKIFHEGKYFEYANFYDYTSSYPNGTVNSENANDEITTDELNSEDWELTLPSGAKIGHRSLALYYRQNLPPVRRENPKRLIHKVISHYRAIGWMGTTSEIAKQKAKDINYMKNLQAKQKLKLGVRGNKLQHHFRPQVMF